MAKKPKKEAGKTQKSIYLPEWLWLRLDEQAVLEKRSINSVVEIILEREYK